MSVTIGTCHFVSIQAARKYYRPYGFDNVDRAVDRKIKDGEIRIGAPDLKPGQRLVIIDDGTRYAIEE